jgi:O-antigen ligase
MMALVPALGAPGERLVQDTLKSILVAFFALGAAAVFFWHQRKQNATIRVHALLWLPLGLMVYALSSMAWSHTYLGGVEAIRWFLFGLILILGMNTLSLIRVTHLVWGIHLGAVIASLWAALQFWINFGFFSQGPNPASTFVNRNLFAEFIVCSLPFSALLLTRVRDKTSVFLLTLSLGFNVVALLMTGTRSALIGLLVLAVILPAITLRCRKQFASMGWGVTHGFAVALLLVSTIAVLGSINTTNPKVMAETGTGDAIDRAFMRSLSMTKSEEFSHGSFSIRAQMWKATGRMILENPVAGVGAGAWEVQAPLYQDAGSQLEIDYYAHNEILQLLAEYGLVGFLALFGLAAYLLWAVHKTFTDQTIEGQREAPVRAFTLASLAVFLLISNAGFPWRLATTGALFSLSLSILAASDARLKVGIPRLLCTIRWTVRDSWWALSATAMCAVLAAYIAQRAVECESKLVQGIKIALTISQSANPNDPYWDSAKIEMLQLMREGIHINPHYRKLTPVAADAMAGWGDWQNATWIWESVLESRPNVVILLANVARAHLHAGNFSKAEEYFHRAKTLQPTAPTLASLEVTLWSKMGRTYEAALRATELLQAGVIDRDLVQVAYSLGRLNNNPQLAILALELGIKTWPSRAVDGWLKLGGIYDSTEAKDEKRAIQAYRSALEAAPLTFKNAVMAVIPPAHLVQIERGKRRSE